MCAACALCAPVGPEASNNVRCAPVSENVRCASGGPDANETMRCAMEANETMRCAPVGPEASETYAVRLFGRRPVERGAVRLLNDLYVLRSADCCGVQALAR